MPPVRKITCLRCKQIRPPAGRGLCAACLREYRAEHDTARAGTRERSHYAGGWRQRSQREIAAHVAVHGYTCTRCSTADRVANPLQLDHVVARDPSETQVLCRRCNARKSNT